MPKTPWPRLNNIEKSTKFTQKNEKYLTHYLIGATILTVKKSDAQFKTRFNPRWQRETIVKFLLRFTSKMHNSTSENAKNGNG